MAKLANVAVSEAVGVITLGVRVSPRAQVNEKVHSLSGFFVLCDGAKDILRYKHKTKKHSAAGGRLLNLQH